MPEARSAFPEFEAMEPHLLHARYQELVVPYLTSEGRIDITLVPQIPDDTLREMVVIMQQLRKRSAGPPKASKPSNGPRGVKDIPGASDL